MEWQNKFLYDRCRPLAQNEDTAGQTDGYTTFLRCRQKLHTGRSRNDQVALDMKLYTRDEIGEIDKLLKKCIDLLETLLGIMEENIETYMPGFTHHCRKI